MKNESMEIKTFWEKLKDRKKKKQTKHKMVFIGESENKPEWESLERTGFTTKEAIEGLSNFSSFGIKVGEIIHHASMDFSNKPRAIYKTKEGKE